MRNLTEFLSRGAGAMLLILSGLFGVLQTTSAEDGNTPWDYAKDNVDLKDDWEKFDEGSS